MHAQTADLLLDARAQLGEGPVWHAGEQCLYWVDIDRGELHRTDPDARGDQVFPIGQKIGCAIPRRTNGFILGLARGLYACETAGGALVPIADPESAITGNRFNDGKCDPAGRLFAGTIGRAGTASLWRLDANRVLHHVLRGLACSNGLAWSGDGKTFYFIDTPTHEILAFNYEVESGELSGRRVAVVVPRSEGAPDGMAIDAEDKLWVAHWGGGQVVRWDPQSGRALQRFRVPATKTTSCAFGGPRRDRLYITTARGSDPKGDPAREPHAGGVFVADPGVAGALVPEFAG